MQEEPLCGPNHLTEQWASEFLRLYPGANILAAAKKDFEPARRKKFCLRIATGDYDAVIIGHTQFEKIPLSFERQAALIERQIDEITLSHDRDAALYHECMGSMEENVSEIAGAIRQGDTGHLTEWLADIIADGMVPGEVERAVELLGELNDYKPLARTPEMEEQNCSMIDNVPDNGAGEKPRKEENKKLQEKPDGRVSLRERLAQKQAAVSGRGNEPQEGKKKGHREM